MQVCQTRALYLDLAELEPSPRVTVHTTAPVDDLDDTLADETVYFGLDGTRYVIDLTHAHADALPASPARFLVATRPVTPPEQRQRLTRASERATGGSSPKELRAWAAAQGMVVTPAGPIPFAVRDRYADAHR